MPATAQMMSWYQTCDKPLFEEKIFYFTDAYMHYLAFMS